MKATSLGVLVAGLLQFRVAQAAVVFSEDVDS